MFGEVIAGFDGHEGGHDAIALAHALGPQHLTIVAAYGSETYLTAAATGDYWRALQEATERRLQAARLELGVEAELLAVADTSPAHVLHEAAAQRDADLLVVGSAHRGRIGRIVLGDVARAVLHGAPCPVAVAPQRFRETPWAPHRIAVAYDGSPEARPAIDLALALAREGDAQLLICTAWQAPTPPNSAYAQVPDISEIIVQSKQAAQRMLDKAVANAGTATQGRLLTGLTGPSLCAVSEDVDLMIAGSRGWGPARRVLLGSTSDHLIHHAHCPVIVVPRPADPEADGKA